MIGPRNPDDFVAMVAETAAQVRTFAPEASAHMDRIETLVADLAKRALHERTRRRSAERIGEALKAGAMEWKREAVARREFMATVLQAFAAFDVQIFADFGEQPGEGKSDAA